MSRYPLLLGVLFACLWTGAVFAAANPRGVPIEVEPLLREHGVNATTAVVQDGVDSGPDASQDRSAVVFVTFDRAFHGKLHVRGYLKDGTEVVRSRMLAVNAVPNQGGHMTFLFDNSTSFRGVVRLALRGTMEPRPPRKETIGQETENIIKELVQ